MAMPEMEARFRRLWLVDGAQYITDLIGRFWPIGDGLVDLASRFARVDYRQVGERRWRTTCSMEFPPIPDDYECCPGGAACECQVIGVRR